MNFSTSSSLKLLAPAQAAGTSTVVTEPIDLSGYESVMVFAEIAVGNPGNAMALAQSVDDDAYSLLPEVVSSGDDRVVLIDLVLPQQALGRFVRAEIRRTVATATGPVFALAYGPRTSPTTHAAEVLHAVQISPAVAP